jgi:hypothetical protein
MTESATPEELQQLVAQAEEKLRIAQLLNEQLAAQIEASKEQPTASRWFFYKLTAPTLRVGLVDMGDIYWIEGTQPARGAAMTYRLYLRCGPKQTELDEANFLAFDKAWKAYNGLK